MAGRSGVVGYSYRAAYKGPYLLRCLLLAALLVALTGALAVLALSYPSAATFLLAFLLSAAAFWLLFPRFSLVYDVEITDGFFTLAAIYGSSRRKEIFSCDLRRAEAIVTDEEARRLAAASLRTVKALSAPGSEKACALFCPDGSNRPALVLFDAEDAFFDTARAFCPAAVRR
ncbi:MAG: hypothetical protein IJR89_04790 [Clostridia bacterium]|nr:hypothetical protein [Clostridia bacterium]